MRALVLAALVLMVVRPAAAHAPSSPMAVTIVVTPERLRAVLRYDVPTGAAARELREQFDRDASGALDGEEQAVLAGFLATRAVKAFGVKVGGRAVAMAPGAATLALGSGEADWLQATVSLDARVKWSPGASRIDVAVELPAASAVTPVGVSVQGLKKSGMRLEVDASGGEASRGAPLVFSVTRR